MEQRPWHITSKMHVPWPEKLLPFHPPWPVQIHAYSHWFVPITDCGTVWLITKDCQRSYLPQDVMRCVRTPPNGDPSKPIAVQMARSPQILQIQANTGTLETRNVTHHFHPGGWLLWCVIRQQGQCRPFDKMLQEQVQTHLRLGRQPVLWHQVEVELQWLNPGHFDTWVYNQTAQKYKHSMPTKPQHCPYNPQPRQYGSNAQLLLPLDTSPSSWMQT